MNQGFCFAVTISSYLMVILVLYLLLVLAGDVELNPGPEEEHTGFLDICHPNIHSLSDKFGAVKALLAGNYDIIAITETLLRPHHDTSKLNLNKFYLIL